MITSVQTTSVSAFSQPPVAVESVCAATSEMRMLALIVRNQLVQSESARTSVELNQEQLQQLRELVRQALEEAREARESSGFWGDIGDVLGGDIATFAQVVVVAATCVATGGAAAIALGAIAIACTVAAKYSEELGIPPKVAIGIAIAGALASVGSGYVGGAAQTSSLASASSAAGSSGSAAGHARTVVEVAKQVRQVASIVAPTAQAVGAIAHGASGYYAGEAVDHKADAQSAEALETLRNMDLDAAIELLADAIDRQLVAFAAASEISTSNQSGHQTIIQTFSGVA
jgi:hypothetical protein